jgi:hypothetical protein
VISSGAVKEGLQLLGDILGRKVGALQIAGYVQVVNHELKGLADDEDFMEACKLVMGRVTRFPAPKELIDAIRDVRAKKFEARLLAPARDTRSQIEWQLQAKAHPDCGYCNGYGTIIARTDKPRSEGASTLARAAMASSKTFGAMHHGDLPAGARWIRKLNDSNKNDRGSNGYSCPCTDGVVTPLRDDRPSRLPPAPHVDIETVPAEAF